MSLPTRESEHGARSAQPDDQRAAAPKPARARWRFLRAVLTDLVTGGLRMRNGHRPAPGHDVPTDFAGVGVATAADPMVDVQVIEMLQQLGISQVRLDFTYGDQDKHVARFLAALSAQGLRIMLHLIQPSTAARSMAHSAAAREDWRIFVTTCLERFGARVDMVEIGSTVNRRRWAGYTLDGFLAAWAIAHPLVRRHGLPLAGPSVTDFEPPWNVGLLALLAERGQLPDVHTDNLFSERCTEPERYDHKIMGRRLAPLHKYNLVKKARVLQRIGARCGVPKLHSPAAFWTLPRIQRQLPDGEHKQADYLSRYFVLCAASGALQRAYWGALVCHREGLVDDGDHPYPALERITHYAGVDGSPNLFRQRPAFRALAAFAALIPGSRYAGRLNHGEGLEVHAFESADRLIHAVWTINGRAAALHDLYPDDDLAAAQCRGRDGEALAAPPAIVGESPLFLLWPAPHAPRLRHQAGLLTDVRLHLHTDGGQYHVHQDERWRGMVLAASPTEAAQLIAALHPERIGAAPHTGLLRKARNAVWTVPDPRDESRQLVVKQPINVRLHKRILDHFKPSKGLRSWNATAQLRRRGVSAAEPVAWFEQRSAADPTRNWFVCAFVPAELSVRELFSAYAAGAETHAGIDPQLAYSSLSAFLVNMHNRGVFFRDLSGGNVLIRKLTDGTLEFTLIDTGRAHFFDHATPTGKRISDLARVCNKLHPDGRRAFMKAYQEAYGGSLGYRYRLAFALYDLKVALKRRLRRSAWFKRLRR